MTDRLLSRADVQEIVGHSRMKPTSFDNWLTEAYERGFPRPKRIGERSVKWRASEVQKWIDGLKSSDASASPNQKAKAKAKAKAEARAKANAEVAALMAQNRSKVGRWVSAEHLSTDRLDRKKRA